jgi:hypothetical protein
MEIPLETKGCGDHALHRIVGVILAKFYDAYIVT